MRTPADEGFAAGRADNDAIARQDRKAKIARIGERHLERGRNLPEAIRALDERMDGAIKDGDCVAAEALAMAVGALRARLVIGMVR